MEDKITVEVFVLAGGKSRRMGTDKGLVLFQGIPMIRHILNLLDELQLTTSIISSNPDYLQFGKPVYSDVIPDKGPMGGLYTAMENSKATLILLLACDMPSINKEGIESLLKSAKSDKVIAATNGKQISPLFGCYPRSMKEEVKKAILADNLKMQDFVMSQPHILLDLKALKNSEVLENINTREELNIAENKNNRR